LRSTEKAKEISETSPYNKVVHEGKSTEFGVISSSSAYNYMVEAVDLLGLDASVLKLGMTHPLPEKMIGEFLKKHEKIIIVEELEPYLEMQVKAIAKDYAPDVEIYGKMGKPCFSREGELSTRIVAMGLAKITGKKLTIEFGKIDERYAEIVRDLPPRPPILCAGCPHRASLYVMKKVAGEKTVYSTDIGCYALGCASPLRAGDIMTCMGASIGTAEGISKVIGESTLAIIGDSTFFHAGIPGLINAVYNNHKVIVVVLDNLATAMTGHQPHPGTGITGMHTPSEKILIENVAKGCGVKYVKVVDPFKVKETEAVLKEALACSGPSVIVFRSPCTLMVVRERRRKGAEIAVFRITDKCTNCMACVKLLGCPAMVVENGKVRINEVLCAACGLCASVCPYNAIKSETTD
jgi:indolepyruvate ferredoxin oxidoreductase alpha subunit